MIKFRVSGIHDFVEKRVFQIHVLSLLDTRIGGELRHEPLHASARRRFGIPVTSLDKRRADDRHQDDARAERERAAVTAQKVQPAGDRHLEGNHRAGVAHAAYNLGNERGKHHGKRHEEPRVCRRRHVECQVARDVADRQAHSSGCPIGKLGPAQLAHHARAEDKREHGERQTKAQNHAPQRRHTFVGELRDDVAEPEDDGLHDDANHERASVALLRKPRRYFPAAIGTSSESVVIA